MTTSYRLHEHGIRSTRRRYRNAEEYDAACTFKWRCAECGHIEFTPKPETYSESDWDEPPECCSEAMEAVE
jgi:hypothetical protein